MTAKDLKPYHVYYVYEKGKGMVTMVIIHIENIIQYHTLFMNENKPHNTSIEEFDSKYKIFKNFTEESENANS